MVFNLWSHKTKEMSTNTKDSCSRCNGLGCSSCNGLCTMATILGIITALVKLARFVGMCFIILISFFIYYLLGKIPPELYALLASIGISTVVTVIQLNFLFIFILRLCANQVKCIDRVYILNAVCFAIECVAVTTFLAILVASEYHVEKETMVWVIASEVVASGITPYFLLVVRSHYLQGDLTDIGTGAFSTSPKKFKLTISFPA